MPWDKKLIDGLTQRREEVQLGGGVDRIERQHLKGKLTARERLDLLFDTGTFHEVGIFVEGRVNYFGLEDRRVPGDGVVTGYGKINGRLAFASSEDFTVIGGSLGEYHSKKICDAMDKAYEMRVPFISINDSVGARIEEGVSSLAGYSGMFQRQTRASGIIPQIAVIMGPCAGGACYSPALCDFVFMVEGTGYMFITGPDVVRTVTREETTVNELGGSEVHAKKSGACHFSFPDEKACLDGVRDLLSYLPQSNEDTLPTASSEPMDLTKGLYEVVVDDQRLCYNVKTVIQSFIDKHSLFEIHRDFAKNAVVAFGRLEGAVIGIVANQPNCLGGSLDCDASDKIARFIRFCDCFGIPLVTLVDVPAFLPGKNQEYMGIIRHGAKILYAYSEATVPKVTVILRKAYGGAYIAMNSKNMGADIVYAWPTAQIAAMGVEGAVSISFRKQIAQADDQEAEKERLEAEYTELFLNPYEAAARGVIDEIILPEETRERVIAALSMLVGKQVVPLRKKHGNIPL